MSHFQFRKLGSLSAGEHSSNERGQSIVVITLLFVGVVAMLGLVIDGGNAYLQRRRMQNAADGSAFAGAIKLANPGTLTGHPLECAIRYEIEKFATVNGVPGPTPLPNCGTNNTNVVAQYIDQNANPLGYVGDVGSVPGSTKGVSVTVKSTFSTFFLGVVGQTNGAANAAAKASFAPLLSPQSIQPLGRKCDQPNLQNCFTIDSLYDIWDGDDASGNFGWLSWNGENNANYTAAMLDPNGGTMAGYEDPHGVCPSGKIAVTGAGGQNCWVQGSPGVSNSNAIKEQLNAWQAGGRGPLIISIYDTFEDGGSNTNYRIKGFAAFTLVNYDIPGKVVYGKFVKWVPPGDLCTSCMDTGLNSVHLHP